jgi:dipeptide/tripeptide permease
MKLRFVLPCLAVVLLVLLVAWMERVEPLFGEERRQLFCITMGVCHLFWVCVERSQSSLTVV